MASVAIWAQLDFLFLMRTCIHSFSFSLALCVFGIITYYQLIRNPTAVHLLHTYKREREREVDMDLLKKWFKCSELVLAMLDMDLLKKWFKCSELVLAMLMVQIFGTGMQFLSKVILSEGTSIFALMAYRHIVAAICVAPFAFFFERITSAMGLFYYGLRDTTPTYATDFLNLIPIATFVLSIIIRIEKLNLQTREDKVKTFGVIVCGGGPSLLAFTRERHFICANTAIALVSLSVSTQLMLTGHVALSCWPVAACPVLRGS